jgi:methylthioribulose-1-phosphate dehydratase
MSDTQKLEQASRELIRVVGGFHGRDWCQGTGGNFSLVLEQEPLRLLMTPSGVDKGRLSADQLLQIGESGQILGDEPAQPATALSPRPSAECALHLALVRVAGAKAVLHTHSIWATLLGERHLAAGEVEFSGYEMQKGIEGVTTHDRQIALPIVSNSQQRVGLAAAIEQVVAARPDVRGVLIAGHGLYAWGATLTQAQRHVEIYEFLLELVGRRSSLPPLQD